MATKNCPKCDSPNPVACKKCACGHVFFTTRRSANALAVEANDDISEPTTPQEPELPRRRTARVTRERPQFYDALQVENQTRRQRELQKRRKASKSDETEGGTEDVSEKASTSQAASKRRAESPPPKVAEPAPKKRRGRPPGLTSRRSGRAQILASKPSETVSKSIDGQEVNMDAEMESVAGMHDVPPLKALQMNMVLADINSRISSSSVRADSVVTEDDAAAKEDGEKMDTEPAVKPEVGGWMKSSKRSGKGAPADEVVGVEKLPANVKGEAAEKSANVKEEAPEESTKAKDEALEESMKATDEALEESANVKEEALEESTKVKDEAVEESSIVKNEAVEQSVTAKDEAVEESTTAKDEAVEESEKAKDEAVEESTNANDKVAKESENANDESAKESANANGEAAKESVPVVAKSDVESKEELKCAISSDVKIEVEDDAKVDSLPAEEIKASESGVTNEEVTKKSEEVFETSVKKEPEDSAPKSEVPEVKTETASEENGKDTIAPPTEPEDSGSEVNSSATKGCAFPC